jgi:hypothetical protein
MFFLKRYRELLLAVAVLTICSVMVVQQTLKNQSRHVELREALILLHTRGYKEESDRLYLKLLESMSGISDRQLMDDFQRTLTLVDPDTPAPDNPIWNYHWTVSNKLEKRAGSTLARALRLANED